MGHKNADTSPVSTSAAVTRAVTRLIEPGNSATCAICDEPVKFVAKLQGRQVIANVYADGKWDRVEHFHAECYEQSDSPYGKTA